MKDRYSFIAPVYSLLAKLVFGTDLKKSKLAFITELNTKKLLIVGGGDGLDYRDFAKEMNGEYWELSSAMMDRAKKYLGESDLSFHLGQFKVNDQESFDEIWLHFVLDTMPDTDLEKFLIQAKQGLKEKGQIYICDFFPPQSFKQRTLHWLMLIFFRITTNHPRRDLPNYSSHLKRLGMKQKKEMTFRDGWIRSLLWEKDS